MSKGMPAKTRQEQKADEKELSWRDIMKQSPDYIQGFVEAVQKEAKSFEQWRCLRPIPPEEEQEIMSNPELKKRVINSQRMLQRQEQRSSTSQCKSTYRGTGKPRPRSTIFDQAVTNTKQSFLSSW